MDSENYNPVLVLGKFMRDFIITSGGVSVEDVPGGGLYYTCAGLSCWEEHVGVVSRISADFPKEWLLPLQCAGFDLRGVKTTSECFEQRNFICCAEHLRSHDKLPLACYAEENIPFPRKLLGYYPDLNHTDSVKSRRVDTLITRDIPHDFNDALWAHFAPADFLTHSLLLSHLSLQNIPTLSLQAADGYMNPLFLPYMTDILRHTSFFFVEERQLRNLFEISLKDEIYPWIERLAQLFDGVIVINLDNGAKIGFEHRQPLLMPVESDVAIFPVGGFSAFCGGFISGYRETYDLCDALAYGAAVEMLIGKERNPLDVRKTIRPLIKIRVEQFRKKVIQL